MKISSRFGRIAVTMLFAAAVAGCVSTLRVKSSRDDSGYAGVPGLPFYKKTTVYLQETVYEEPRSVVTAEWRTYPSGDPKKTLVSGTIGPALVLGEARVVAYIDQLTRTAGKARLLQGDSFDDVIAALEADATAESKHTLTVLSGRANAMPAKADLRLVANRMVAEQRIDTSKTYFVNGRLPWIGKGESEFALSADQTLTSAKSVVEPKTLETLLAMVPAKEKLLQRWDLIDEGTEEASDSVTEGNKVLMRFGQPALLAVGRPVPPPAKTKLELTITRSQEPVTYRFRKACVPTVDQACPPATVVGPIDPATATTGGAELVEVVVPPTRKPEKEKPDPGKVAFSGAIQLPPGLAGGAAPEAGKGAPGP